MTAVEKQVLNEQDWHYQRNAFMAAALTGLMKDYPQDRPNEIARIARLIGDAAMEEVAKMDK